MRVVAEAGDTVDSLCQQHLGRTGGVVEQVYDLNPGLAALGPTLHMGTVVILPDVELITAPVSEPLRLWD